MEAATNAIPMFNNYELETQVLKVKFVNAHNKSTRLRCGHLLTCGHKCSLSLHSDDPQHRNVKCFADECDRI